VIECLKKTVPLFFRVVKSNPEKDLELYWSFTHEHPSPHKNDGSFKKQNNINVVIQPFGCNVFCTENIYFGLYSRTGATIKMGFSFERDYFAEGQLSSTEEKVEPKFYLFD
jgi:hypothetical protein